MKELTAVVTEIQRASINDGPGIRTTVFFKGCPLHCAWCHNPECISAEPQIMFYPEKCIGCGMCKSGCYSGARVVCGKEMTADEIFSQLLLDKDYYGAEGGVTFSGGEPLLQSEMLKVLIQKCRESGIKTAAETSLCIFNEEIFKNLNFVMADFKIFDSEKHLKYTGIKNEIITENFRLLDETGTPFLVRTPVIPGINDTRDEISAIRDFVKTLKNAVGYELLPYHPLGVVKQKALGLKTVEFEIPAKEHMEELKRYAQL